MQHKIRTIIGAAVGFGSGVHSTEQAPDYLKKIYHLTDKLKEIQWGDTIYADHYRENVRALGFGPAKLEMIIAAFNEEMALATHDAIKKNQFPIVIGGDHSCAIGTWSGITTALKAENYFGLIYIDAHMDAHTPQTTETGLIHGMPVAALMGYGQGHFTHLMSDTPKINPEHLVLIGTRSFEVGEEYLLKRLNVKIFTPEDVAKKGIKAVIAEAIKIVTNGTVGFGLTFDLDSLDPQDAPGVGTPEPNGLRKAEIIPALTPILQHPLLKAVEIVELNPTRDHNNKTADIIPEILNLLP